MNEAKPKRRWFRFSLRTMFVLVAVFAVALAVWTNKDFRFVLKREQYAQILQDFDKTGFQSTAILSSLKNPDKSLPKVRRLFGDHKYSMIILPRTYTKDLVDEAVSLFPEAQIEQWEVVPADDHFRRPHLNKRVIQEMK